MRTILLPFDGSAPAMRAIQYLLNWADGYAGIQVHLITVQPMPQVFGDYASITMLEQLRAGALAHAKTIIAEASALLEGSGIRFDSHTEVGEVVGEIVRAVEEYGCDTVVMGTRGMSKLGNLLMGSVATQVVHEVPVPVLLVK
ncbi:Universal stress protein [compost metagenome]